MAEGGGLFSPPSVAEKTGAQTGCQPPTDVPRAGTEPRFLCACALCFHAARRHGVLPVPLHCPSLHYQPWRQAPLTSWSLLCAGPLLGAPVGICARPHSTVGAKSEREIFVLLWEPRAAASHPSHLRRRHCTAWPSCPHQEPVPPDKGETML